MGPFEMIVAIVFIGVVGGIVRTAMKNRKAGSHDIDDYLAKTGLSEKLSRVEQLERRVEVLEKIVTDKSSVLAEEIERL